MGELPTTKVPYNNIFNEINDKSLKDFMEFNIVKVERFYDTLNPDRYINETKYVIVENARYLTSKIMGTFMNRLKHLGKNENEEDIINDFAEVKKKIINDYIEKILTHNNCKEFKNRGIIGIDFSNRFRKYKWDEILKNEEEEGEGGEEEGEEGEEGEKEGGEKEGGEGEKKNLDPTKYDFYYKFSVDDFKYSNSVLLKNYDYTEENEIFKNLKNGTPHRIVVKYRYFTVKSKEQQVELSITMYKFYVAALIRYYYCFMYLYFYKTSRSNPLDVSDYIYWVTEASKTETLTSENDNININVLFNTHSGLTDVNTLFTNSKYIALVFLFKKYYYRYLTEQQTKNFWHTLDKPVFNHLNIDIEVSSRKNKIPGSGQYGGKSITHKRKNKRIRKTNRNIKNKTHKSNSINKKRRTCKK